MHMARVLQDLVRIPSVNPEGDPGVATHLTGESRVAEYVAGFLRKLAIDVELHEVEPGRPNVVGKFSSRGGKRSVALAPHTDTVSVAGMTISAFAGDFLDGRLYGRGATDTKGSIAAMLAALANAARQKSFREGDLDVYFCAMMGEESGNDGARALMKRGFKVDFAIAGEPTECRIVYTHKGALWFKLATPGKTAHGATPEAGESAIAKMAEVVQFLLGEYADGLKGLKRLNELKTGALGAPTVNVGTIHGGSQINVVPGSCEIEVDRRTVPGENHAAILDDLRKRLQHVAIGPKIIRDCRPLYTDPKNEFVQKLAAATGQADALTGAPWFCDAAIFAEHGMPAVAFGPGSTAQAHTPDEFIELSEVARAASILERFLLECAAGDFPN
jgi:acetylornithine deacetylase/succinyl-diaminopimelate desuccinylase family protein